MNTRVHSYYFCVRWSDKMSAGLSPLLLCCGLVPGLIHSWSVCYSYVINTKPFILLLLWKISGNKTLLLLSVSEEHLSFLCPFFLLESDSVLIAKSSRTLLGYLKFLDYLSGLITGEWHYHFPLTIQFLWACNFQFGHTNLGQ